MSHFNFNLHWNILMTILHEGMLMFLHVSQAQFIMCILEQEFNSKLWWKLHHILHVEYNFSIRLATF
jgi:hypothetical protein